MTLMIVSLDGEGTHRPRRLYIIQQYDSLANQSSDTHTLGKMSFARDAAVA